MNTNKDIELISRLNEEWRSGVSARKAGGQTNRNWIVGHKKKKFFVRFPWERTDIVNRKTEGKNILALAKCEKLKGVVPQFYLYVLNKRNILNERERHNFPDGTMVAEYIKGRDINGKDLEIPKTRRALVKALHSFHTSGIKFANTYDVFRDEVLKYKKKAKRYQISKLLSGERVGNIEKIGRRVQGKLPLGGKISTHNDLIFENLRLGEDGRIYLLDFEYAGLNIRSGLHYDLGIILGGNLFYPKPIRLETFNKFLESAEEIYKRDLDYKEIYYGALTNILVMFWWGTVKYFSSTAREEKKYFREYVLKRARKIEDVFAFINKNKTGVRLS